MGEKLLQSLWARVGADWDVFSEELWSSGYCGPERDLRKVFNLCRAGQFDRAAQMASRTWF